MIRKYDRKQGVVVRPRDLPPRPKVDVKYPGVGVALKGGSAGVCVDSGGSDVCPVPRTSSFSEATGCVRSSRASRTALGEAHLSLSLPPSIPLPLSLSPQSDDPHGSRMAWEISVVDSSEAYHVVRMPTWPSANRATQLCHAPQYAHG